MTQLNLVLIMMLAALPTASTLAADSSSPAASGDALPVLSVTENDSGVFFRRADLPEAVSYAPKTEARVECDPLAPGARTSSCRITLARKAITVPEGWTGERIFYPGPVPTGTDCILRTHSDDSRLLTNVKRLARLDIPAEGITPASADAPVCQFSLFLAGTEDQRDSVLAALKQQAQAGTLVASPLELKLAQRDLAGQALQDELRSLGLTSGTELSRDEALFLIGVASGQSKALMAKLNSHGSEARPGYFTSALDALFSAADSDQGPKLRFAPLDAPDSRVYFEKVEGFQL